MIKLQCKYFIVSLFVIVMPALIGISCNKKEAPVVPEVKSTQQHYLVPEELFKKAVNLYRMKRYVEAAETFERYIALFPRDPLVEKAEMYKVKCHEENPDEMRLAIQQFIQKYPFSKSSAELLFTLATNYLLKHKDDEALDIFKQIADQYNQFDDIAIGALEKQVVLYKNSRKDEDVLRVLDKIASTYPFSNSAPKSLFSMAMMYEAKRDYSSAYNIYIKLRNIYPDYRSTDIQDIIRNYEGDWNHNGIPNVTEMQNGKDPGNPPDYNP